MVVLLAGAPAPAAASPQILSVGEINLHPEATFTASSTGNDPVIQIATSPDRSSNGGFLTEHTEVFDVLTGDERTSGRWLYASQIDPGRYFVMISQFDCTESRCGDSYSNVVTLDIERPTQDFSGRVQISELFKEAWLTLRASPAGNTPYRVCWRRAGRRRDTCVRGAVTGSWNAARTDRVDVKLRGMKRRTTFRWVVAGREVARRTVRVL